MKIAICDDDILFLNYFSKQVQKIKGVKDVETYSSYKVFLGNLQENYDLVFMDIDWETEKNGIDVAAIMRKEHSGAKIIFVTAYIDRFAEQVFLQKTNIFGILTKPVAQDMLETYVQRVRSVLKEEMEKVLKVKENNRLLTIPVSDILYLESHNHVVDIVTGQQIYHIYEPLADIEKRLTEEFCRCHRSFIINMSYMKELTKSEITLANDQSFPIGRSYRSKIETAYLTYLSGKI